MVVLVHADTKGSFVPEGPAGTANHSGADVPALQTERATGGQRLHSYHHRYNHIKTCGPSQVTITFTLDTTKLDVFSGATLKNQNLKKVESNYSLF